MGFEVGKLSDVVGNGVLTGPGTGGSVEGVGATGCGVTMIGRGVGGGDTGAFVVGISPLSIVGTSVGVKVGISVSSTGGKVGLVVGLGVSPLVGLGVGRGGPPPLLAGQNTSFC